MSSKFLERLDEIREGAPPQLGFGPRRGERLPGLALVVDIGDKVTENLESTIALSPDAIIISSRYGDAAIEGELDSEAAAYTANKTRESKIPWGGRIESRTTTNGAAEWREAGADLLVFKMENTALGAVTSKDAARVLVVDSGLPPEELRDINPLPVDAVLVSLPGNPSEWTLQDLSAVARVSGRVGKHMLVEISGAPDGDALESLRNAGVAGLVVGLSLGEEAISGLKDALLNMPRPGADRRSRSSAILPGSVYTARRPAPAEDDPDDDD